MHRLPLLILALLLLPPSISRAEELHVPGEHATIKAAIKAAEDGDHILVAPGTYIERLNSKGKAITIQGEQGAEATIIDATGQGRDSAMTCNSSETSSTRLINLTFTGGLGQMNMTRGEIMGGGALVVDASPTFIQCIFRDNFARYGSGGGIAITGGSPCFINCRITRNKAEHIAGGLLAKECNPLFLHCLFDGNSGPCGGGAYIWHDGLPTFESCTFTHNEASLFGGGIFNWKSTPLLNSCEFRGNIAPEGAGICNLAGAPILIATEFGPDQDIKHAQASALLEEPTPAPPALDTP